MKIASCTLTSVLPIAIQGDTLILKKKKEFRVYFATL